MRLKIGSKKWAVLVACVAFVVAFGVVSASASSPYTTLQVKVENGVPRYSTDDGNTWSAEAPDGVTWVTDADGKVTVTRGVAPGKEESGTPESVVEGGPIDISGVASLFVKVEDGVKQYSTDGGKTWSAQPAR
ncbi:MAG: exo-alpha-sialidase [Bacillota bacterium]|nr:MAG: exo-alpha-sialidase [Bacillota bacterium]